MLESSLPNALVATQENRAESERSVLLMLKSERTPLGKISSRIVYLDQRAITNFAKKFDGINYLLSLLGSNLLLFMFHRIPIGFSPLASHWRTVGSLLLDV
jgi:hypothetical protein